MEVRVIIVEDMEASVRVEVDGSVTPAPLDPHVPALAVKVHLTEELAFRISDLLFFFRHIVILSRGAGELIGLVRLGWSRELCWPGRACLPCLAQLYHRVCGRSRALEGQRNVAEDSGNKGGKQRNKIIPARHFYK